MPLAAHADWSVSPSKRVMSVASPRGSGWVLSIEAVGDVPSLLDRLCGRAQDRPAVLGVDAPIGLPLATRRDALDFPAFLRSLSAGSLFFKVCDTPDEIGPGRPFYPRRSHAGVRRQSLLDGLGLHDADQLIRRCERPVAAFTAASPLFWTLGAKQVGKAAIILWRDLLLPALNGPVPPLLWPFDGALAGLLRGGRVAVAETYPADTLRDVAFGWRGSKRRRSDRQAVAPLLLAALAGLGAAADPALARQCSDGFGDDETGEDRFDSLLGLFRLLQTIRDPVLDQLPAEDVRRWEGWILGRPVIFD